MFLIRGAPAAILTSTLKQWRQKNLTSPKASFMQKLEKGRRRFRARIPENYVEFH